MDKVSDSYNGFVRTEGCFVSELVGVGFCI